INAVTFYSSLPGSLTNGDTSSARHTYFPTANSITTKGFGSETSGRAAQDRNFRRPQVFEFAGELGGHRSHLSLGHGVVRPEYFRDRRTDFGGIDDAIQPGLAPIRP